MALSATPRHVPGVWGPYFGAVLPGLWLNEGGQSVTGALLDHVIRLHSAGGAPDAAMHARIIDRLAGLRAAKGPEFAARLHVLPDFHGNRSPLADPHAVGVISGLTMDASFDGLCQLYYRTALAIALGTRHILQALNGQGYAIDTLHVTGGHTKNPLLMELYADATGCTVVAPEALDAVLLGTGMVAATAAGLYPDLAAAAAGMARPGRERRPDPAAAARSRARLAGLPAHARPAPRARRDRVSLVPRVPGTSGRHGPLGCGSMRRHGQRHEDHRRGRARRARAGAAHPPRAGAHAARARHRVAQPVRLARARRGRTQERRRPADRDRPRGSPRILRAPAICDESSTTQLRRPVNFAFGSAMRPWLRDWIEDDRIAIF